LEGFVKLKLYTDRRTEDNVKNKKIKEEVYKSNWLPLYVFLTPDGKEVARLPKSLEDPLPSAQDFIEALRKAKNRN
jgi:hypothetical protein